MRCEQNLCIYNANYECILSAIEINELGMCDSCILMDIDEALISKEKEKQLDRLEGRYELLNQ